MGFCKRRFYTQILSRIDGNGCEIPYVECFYGVDSEFMWWVGYVNQNTGMSFGSLTSQKPELKITLWEF